MKYKSIEARRATENNNLIVSARAFYEVAASVAVMCGKPFSWALDMTLKQFGQHAHEAMATLTDEDEKKV